MAAARENHLFCFGLGYTARVLARRLRAEGWRISGTTRDADKLAALAAEGIAAVRFARDTPIDPGRFADASHVLSAVPPDDTGDAVLDVHGADLAALQPTWAGYLSTTGVYGDRAGGWVDEAAALKPVGVRGHRRVTAEACSRPRWRGLIRVQSTTSATTIRRHPRR